MDDIQEASYISDPKLRALYKYLLDYCINNEVELSCKALSPSLGGEAILLHSNYKQHGSLGLLANGDLKCVLLDRAIYHRSKLEGFTETQIFSDDFLEPILKEVSFQDLASHLIYR